MKLFQNLKIAADTLQQWPGCWAVCGEIAACLYRQTPRYTADIDFALINHATASSLTIAEHTIQQLGNKPIAG